LETQIGYQKRTIHKQIPVFWKFVIAIVLCEGTGLLSGLFSSAGMSGWYETLSKPVWNPPSFIFAPVWTVLYLMMGIALALVWQAHTEIIKEKTALYLFGVQLFFNFWWSIIFFRFHTPGWAFIEMILLIVCILSTILEFIRINKTAAWLLVPYFAWVCFAAILNATIWLMNV
jgi:tryptophan-rich sensory protein